MKTITLSGMFAAALMAAPMIPVATSAPVGPGGVYHAAKDLIEAVDSGDADYLKKAFVTRRHGIEWTFGEDGKERTAEPKTPFDFVEVGADGTSWSAHTLKDLIAGLDGQADAERGRPTSIVTSAYADCPSEGCSYVHIEFDRSWGKGKGLRTVPMRATALVRWVGGEAPLFRVFHWHASPR